MGLLFIYKEVAISQGYPRAAVYFQGFWLHLSFASMYMNI